MSKFERGMVLIAHRGDTINHEENTLAAFRSAFSLGADGVEMDAQVCDSGEQVFVVHDYLYDRNFTYPLLRDILDDVGMQGKILVESKSLEVAAVETLANVLNRYPEYEIELLTSVFHTIPTLRDQIPDRVLGVVFHPYHFEKWMSELFITRKLVATMEGFGAQVAYIPPNTVTMERVRALHDSGVLVHSHIQNSLDQVEIAHSFADIGVDRCTFDNINLIMNLR